MNTQLRRLAGTALIAGLLLLLSAPSAYACCNYGCCDCGCIALRLEKDADSIARSVAKKIKGKGSIDRFTVNVSQKRPASKWKCAPTTTGATCTRE